MRKEHITRRLLGAVRFVDANIGTHVRRSLSVTANGDNLIRNRGGHYLIFAASGLDDHREAFEHPPESPTVGSISIELMVEDPKRRYLPRKTTVLLPRDPNPENEANEESLFRAINVELFPAPTANELPGWAVIRALCLAKGSGERLPGAMVRVLRDDDEEVLARGLSDWRERARGEVMIGVPGIPVTTWSHGNGDDADDDGPVVISEIHATLEVAYDQNFNPAEGDLPDPDDLEARWDDLPSSSLAVRLASGKTITATIQVDLT